MKFLKTFTKGLFTTSVTIFFIIYSNKLFKNIQVIMLFIIMLIIL
jgi:hypothetical protein